MKKNKLIIIIGLILVLAVTAITLVWRFVGFPKAVGGTKYAYTTQEIHTVYNEIDLYGVALIPKREGKLPTVIYAHGAESDYRADMATLKSLAMSGIAVYTFDFYGWTDRSTGPRGTHWFKNVPRGVDNAYELQLLNQVQDLNAVIENVKTFDFVDAAKIFLLGSSMGGATVATCTVTHSEDIRAIILQYPAIILNPEAMVDGAQLDVNGYTQRVLILQGTEDVIVPLKISQALTDHYNSLYPDHARLVIYQGQPHVFNGKYKVEAAKEIYRFIQNVE